MGLSELLGLMIKKWHREASVLHTTFYPKAQGSLKKRGRKILRARGGGWVTTKPTVFQSQYSSYLMGITECIKPIQVQSIPKVSVEQEVGTNSHPAAEELWVTGTCQEGKVSFP